MRERASIYIPFTPPKALLPHFIFSNNSSVADSIVLNIRINRVNVQFTLQLLEILICLAALADASDNSQQISPYNLKCTDTDLPISMRHTKRCYRVPPVNGNVVIRNDSGIKFSYYSQVTHSYTYNYA